MVKEHENATGMQYEALVRARTDYRSDVRGNLTISPNVVYLPRKERSGAFNDKYAIGGRRAMEKYLSIYDTFQITFLKECMERGRVGYGYMPEYMLMMMLVHKADINDTVAAHMDERLVYSKPFSRLQRIHKGMEEVVVWKRK